MTTLTDSVRPAGAAFSAPCPPSRRAVALWLLICCALVYTMVVVGGVTRLTRSGLSIVEWQPIMGALPPLSEQAWNETFAKYRLSPEYKLVNRGMSLEEFKGIFWWEYIHRLLGRLIGLAFLIPFLYFLVRRALERPLAIKLAGVFVLGGLQGAMGWYMVKSGLVDNPAVSHLRLTSHLLLAVIIYSAMLWIALDLVAARSEAVRRGLWRAAAALAILVILMIGSGGMVAGLRAGYAYNTFPLMNGHLVPPEIFMLDPWPSNFVWNMATVQFVHRTIAWILVISVPFLWWRARIGASAGPLRIATTLFVLALLVQFTLGILTLLERVPVVLGALHQAGGMLVLTAAIVTAHCARLPRSTSA